MANAAVATEPSLPFLRISRRQVLRFSLETGDGRSLYRHCFLQMYATDFANGLFKEDAYLIDVDCRKFPIIDVVSLGRGGTLWERLFSRPRVKVRYVYGSPVQLSFEQARTEIVELICSRRWFSKTQDRESEKQFRERMARCENMRELILGVPNTDPETTKRYQWIGGISFYGEWVG